MLKLSVRFGEWDIKLKNKSIFNSFRFEVVLYSILSLLYTIVTEALIYCFLYYSKRLYEGIVLATDQNISFDKILNEFWSLSNQQTSFIDGTSSTGLTHSLTTVLAINRD